MFLRPRAHVHDLYVVGVYLLRPKPPSITAVLGGLQAQSVQHGQSTLPHTVRLIGCRNCVHQDTSVLMGEWTLAQARGEVE